VIHLANVRAIVEVFAREAELSDAAEFARQWHMLMNGAIIAACEGDSDAATRIRPVAEVLVERHRPARPARRQSRSRALAQT
jgi:hypothetical protein